MRPTVQMIIDALIEPVGKLDKTVDTLQCGDPHMEVTGIVTTFMPTQQVMEQALALKANLVIAHEGLFFSHQEEGAEDRGGTVAGVKRRFLNESRLAVFRFHDYWHRYQPDGIMAGLLRELDWEPYVRKHQPAASLLTVPPARLADLAEYIKKRLGIPYVRVMGDLNMECTQVGLLAGFRGGAALTLPLYEQEQVELVIYGEGLEWETPEYVRESLQQGNRRALIVLGHAESEEPGMKLLAERLAMCFPEIPVQHVKERPLFRIV